MRHFIVYILLLLPAFASAQVGDSPAEKRCKCAARRDFLLEKSDTCFAITRDEADRFFRCRCWDEAMSLYRAAKSCADANQSARSEMNARIQACRDSAEQELRRSEQAARRQFLHATAAGLADEAQDLLKNYDRSAAYRLADFAGQYIAPGQNPACLQALLDAWYYVPPSQTIGTQSTLRVPFCYQLDYDLGSGVEARFGKKSRLYAFAPSNSVLYSWNTDNWESATPVQIEKGFPHFDLSPDDRTLLFYSDNTLLFWRSPRDTFRVRVAEMGRYCFSPGGEEFFFTDNRQARVYSIELRNSDFVQRDYKNVQRKGERAEKRPEPKLVANTGFEILGMSYDAGRLWLAGYDSIAVLEQSGSKDRAWKRSITQPWSGEKPIHITDIKLFPTLNGAWVNALDSIYYYRLSFSGDTLQSATHAAGFLGTPVAIRNDGSWFAYTQFQQLGVTSDTASVHFGSYLQPDESFGTLSGSISPDNRWLAAATDTGILKIWALYDWQNSNSANHTGTNQIVFSQNGDHFCYVRNDSLVFYATERPDKPLFVDGKVAKNFWVDAIGATWVAQRTGLDTLTLRNINTGQYWHLPVQAEEYKYLVAAFNESGDRVVYAATPDSAVVMDLATGRTLATQSFRGGILTLRFIPGQDEVLVVQNIESGLYAESQTIVKLWNVNAPSGKPRSVRLHGYRIGWSDVSLDGQQIAFSSGKDIRVFRTNNLLDETVRIRQNGERIAGSLAFHPDGTALAAGYDNGSVIVWDLQTGEARYVLHVAEEWIDELSFTADGSRLRVKTLFGKLLSRDLSPDLIRAAAQNEKRRLAAFTPDQIREYGLENALDYAGSFRQLAGSGDLPLIRSFFEYYRQQALSSNNIERVKSYFESASSLYAKLDDPNAQKALRPVMFEIYEDYTWKLLLREKNAEAQKVLNDFNRLFGKPLSATRISAHTALLRHDLPAAARQYADWTMRMFENSASEPFNAMDSLELQFRQLIEYDLLDARQLDCICGLYSELLKIERLCPAGSSAEAAIPLDNETRLRWNIFQRSHKSARVLGYSKKSTLLEAAFTDAGKLYRQNATRWRNQLEQTTLALATAYTEWGVFERGNAFSEKLYRQALQLLDTFGTFKNHEAQRLKAISMNRLLLGIAMLNTDRLSEAGQQFRQGLETTDRLLRDAPTDSMAVYRNDYRARHLTQLGMVHLLEGNAAEAKASYEQADDATLYGLDSYYFGHVALLENKEPEALELYKGIYREDYLGLVQFEIHRLAGRLPKRKTRLEAFATILRDTFLKQHPEMIAELADYWYAEQQTDYAIANKRWEATINWNEKSVAATEKLSERPDIAYVWKPRRLNAILSRSYYLIYAGKTNPDAYDQAIACARQGDAYAAAEYDIYPYRDWFKSNIAHAYVLRNQRGDRETAIALYREFLAKESYDFDRWELLQKDFRDLTRNGMRLPDLKGIIEAIKPAGVQISAKDWQEMGI